MCGIAGIASQKRGEKEVCEIVLRMNATQHHRGPDAAGVQYRSICHAGLGHTRLEIIDLSANGAQPMTTCDGLVTISFNGEVYNFQELRQELIKSGYLFRGHSDTEVVLNAYHCWGEAAFSRFNGMFAFAIADDRNGVVYLVRDRFGIKPLHYSYSDGELVFASEIKAILASKVVAVKASISSLPEYMYFGNSLGERTFYCGITRLLPGTMLKFKPEDSRTSVVCYWKPVSQIGQSVSFSQSADQVRELLDAAVRRQLTADVPVGVFLSGGIDSSAMVALASRHYAGRLRTYSVGFDYIVQENELPNARYVAQLFGTEHHEMHVSGENLMQVIKEVAAAHDAPFADAADIPLYQLCRALGGDTRVVLQGDGGDEIFGGYRRYEYLASGELAPWVFRKLSPILSVLFAFGGSRAQGPGRFFRALASADLSTRMALLMTVEDTRLSPLRVLSSALRQGLAEIDPFSRYREVAASISARDDLEAMLLTDARILLPDIFLQKVDRSTMATSTEVRVPFLDNELVDYMLSVPSQYKVSFGCKKKLLRSALRGVVPDKILSGKKIGFGVPVSAWLRGPLLGFLKENLFSLAGMNEIFDDRELRKSIEDHQSGRRDNGQLLWKCLQLALWCRNNNLKELHT